MATHVYANDLEIACRSTDGVATTAFPDPCWSPPPPKGGPVLIPYGNVAFAPDITNGTCTVFIAGQTVAIEDKAYFATSTGNEPATHQFQKGERTQVITGKAYFRSWSLDVIFEGLGVDRHTDMVSHNHGSMPANTPLFPYISRGWFKHDCSDEEKRINAACTPDKDDSDAKKEVKSKSKLAQLLQARKTKQGGANGANKDWHWTDDHCAGLEVPLGSMEDAKKYAEELSDLFKSLPEELAALQSVEAALTDMVLNAGAEAAAKWGAKAALKQAAGTALPAAGNIAMGAWSLVDGILAIGDVADIKAAATEALEQLEILRNKASDLQKLADDFKDFGTLDDAAKLEKAQEIGQAGQDMLATLNACTRARKCNLVPFKAKGAPFSARNQSKVEPSKAGGCCSGQTGHHLIYGAMAKGACSKYDHDIAPTVCTEGTSQKYGSHGRVHDAMDKEVGILTKNGKVAPDGTMSVDDAIDAAANSHAEAFPLSKCSKKCIKAQLEAYYAQTCRGSRLKAVDKRGDPHKPDTGDSSDD